jgi:hypothetical protein
MYTMTGNKLSVFRGKKGYDSGNTSDAFYNLYIFFEKLRIKAGKEKSKDRVKMEELWGPSGVFDIVGIGANKRMTMFAGTRMTKPNKYGETTLVGPDGHRRDLVW